MDIFLIPSEPHLAFVRVGSTVFHALLEAFGEPPAGSIVEGRMLVSRDILKLKIA